MKFDRACLCGKSYSGNVPEFLHPRFDADWTARHQGPGHGLPPPEQTATMLEKAVADSKAQDAALDAKIASEEAAARSRAIEAGRARADLKKRTGQ